MNFVIIRSHNKKAISRGRVPFLPLYLLCLYLLAVLEGDRDFFVPTHRDELYHAAPMATVKVADGSVLAFKYLDEVRQAFALRFLGGLDSGKSNG